MRKFFFALFLFLIIALGIAFLGQCVSNKMVLLESGCAIPLSIEKKSFFLISDRPDGKTEQWTLRVPAEIDPSTLHLIVTDIRTFSLEVNGDTIYQYSGTPAAHRVHDIPLSAVSLDASSLQITVRAAVLTESCKFLLGTAQNISFAMTAALIFNMLVLGIYLAIIVNCVLLFLRKKSETYLLYMTAFTLCVALTCLLYCNMPIWQLKFWDLLHMGYLHALTQTFGLILCIRLMHIEVFQKYDRWIPGIPLMASVSLVALFNAFFTLQARNLFTSSISLLTLCALIYAYMKKRSGALTLLVGLALCEGLKLYYQLVNCQRIPPVAFFSFVHLPECAYLAFTFFCLLTVDSIFSKKFDEADQLLIEVERANAELDAKVAERTGALEIANRSLLREQERKHAMTTNIFHDLRSPLFSAMGLADMVQGAPGEEQEILGELRGQLVYLSHLTENLLLISKLEEGKITFAQMAVDLSELSRVVFREASVSCSQNGSYLSLSAADGVIVLGDGFRCRQALENLVYNAIRHTPAGSHIQICAKRTVSEAHVSVSDDGPGISAEALPHLFERYYTGHKRSPGEGSGLGLSIAQELIHAQGGRIEVQSTVGKGSVFTIILPLFHQE